MKIKTIAALLSCWVVLLCLPGCGRKPHAGRYKIALVHSYEVGYPDAGRTREMLSDALARRGISCDFREYFLDCDDLLSAGEEERCSDFIDDFTRWGAASWRCWTTRRSTRLWPAAIPACTTCPWCSAA